MSSITALTPTKSISFSQSNLKLMKNTNTQNPTITNINNNINNITVNNNNFPRSYQVTAFCLAFFLPMGAAHYYVGRWWLGLLQMSFMLITPIIIAIFAYCANCCSDSGKCCGINPRGVFICWGVIAGIWYLVDVILFGINNYNDIYGYPLVHW